MRPIRIDNTLADEARRRVTRPPQRLEERREELRDEIVDELDRQRRPRRQPAAARDVQIAVTHVSLRDFLHTREAVRRAIVLHEIIGPPRALRGEDW
jgi:hypothetical protein